MVHCRGLCAGLGLWFVGSLLAGCGSTSTGVAAPAVGRAAYVGSQACRRCHASQFDEAFQQSGHPYKLTRIVNGQEPRWPPNVLRGPYLPSHTPPAGLGWAEVAYVIGGYGWKSRYVDLDGYVVTGDGVQWNLRTRRWVGYNAAMPRGTLAYDYACFQCHTTGAQDGTDDLSTHQDGRVGMKGTFAEAGIGCEACHGPGAAHVERPARENIVRNAGTGPAGLTPTGRLLADDGDGGPLLYLGPGRAAGRQADMQRALTCGECHTRKGVGQIAAKGGFVEHHEQFEELMAAGAHRLLDCITCHDPHRGTIYNSAGIQRNCESCHGRKPTDHAPGVQCVDCHMPQNGKSGDTTSIYQADVHSHVFRIRTTPEARSSFFNEAGDRVALDASGRASLTLDFVCYSCHQDESGQGGPGSRKSLDELAAAAAGMHD